MRRFREKRYVRLFLRIKRKIHEKYQFGNSKPRVTSICQVDMEWPSCKALRRFFQISFKIQESVQWIFSWISVGDDFQDIFDASSILQHKSYIFNDLSIQKRVHWDYPQGAYKPNSSFYRPNRTFFTKCLDPMGFWTNLKPR
jgi:hypothetical protein